MTDKKEKIKVLVVDDSFFMRKLISDVLNEDSEIEVVGQASDGFQCLEKIPRCSPNVIVMDYEMPKMNGLEATRRIMQGDEPRPVVLMLSAYVEEGSKGYEECVKAGAVTCISKPSGALSLDIKQIAEQLIKEVKIAAKARVERMYVVREKRKKRPPREEVSERVVIIGASTGGPSLLEEMISSFPLDLKAAVLIIQHMPKSFTRNFARRLDIKSSLKVKEAEEGEMVKHGVVLLAPGDWHMTLERHQEKDEDVHAIVHLNKEIPIRGLRPAIDTVMESATHVFRGENIIGVILTGMGEDGLKGVRAIKAVGGYTIVQDPTTAVLESMPKAIIDAGLADEILPPEKIAKRIIELTGGGA